MTGDEEIAPDVFLGVRAHLPGDLRVVQEISDPKGRPLYRTHGVAGLIVYDLDRDPTRVTADDRLSLPHGFRNREAESFPH